MTLFNASSHPDATLDVVTPVFPLLKRALKAPYAFGAAICATDIGMVLAKRRGGFGSDTLSANGVVDDFAAAIAANGGTDVEATGVAWRMCEASDANKWLVAASSGTPSVHCRRRSGSGRAAARYVAPGNAAGRPRPSDAADLIR